MYKHTTCLIVAFALLAGTAAAADDDSALVDLLYEGRELIDAGNPEEAIAEYFDKVIADFDAKYGDGEVQ